MDYIKADKLHFNSRPQMGRIFAEGFYQWLKYFSKDKEKLGFMEFKRTPAPKGGGFDNLVYMRKTK